MPTNADRNVTTAHVIGPNGTLLTLANLPAPDTKRWVINRKAEVVAAVQGGLLTLDDAYSRYSLSAEEFASWRRAIAQRVCHVGAQ